jgi:hypothetical protein
LHLIWRATEQLVGPESPAGGQKPNTVQLQEINGGHDFFNWQAGLADGLTALLKTKKGEMKW